MVKETNARVNVNGLSSSAVHGQRDVNVGLIGLSGDGGSADRGGRSGGHGGYGSRRSLGGGGGRKQEGATSLSISVEQQMVASTWTLSHHREKNECPSQRVKAQPALSPLGEFLSDIFGRTVAQRLTESRA